MTLQKGCEQPARDHTIPWSLDEFAVYRGVKLICHYHNGVAFLHFPGGGMKRAYECGGVTMPLRIRPLLLVG